MVIKMNIRLAQISDAEGLSALLAEVWKSTYRGIFPQTFLDEITSDKWVEGFRHTLEQNLSPILVAEIDAQIVGMISAGKARDSELKIPFEIYALNVLPRLQRQYIGQTLMHHIFQHFNLQDDTVYLKVAQNNLNARKFYEKQGFINTEIRLERQIENFSFKEIIYKR